MIRLSPPAEVQNRRQQYQALEPHALFRLQRLREERATKGAVAFTDEILRRSQTPFLSQPPGDEAGERFDVALYRNVALAHALGLGEQTAEAGVDRVDEDQVSKGKPAVRVLDQLDRL